MGSARVCSMNAAILDEQLIGKLTPKIPKKIGITILTLRWRYSTSFPCDLEFVLHGLVAEYQQIWAVGSVKMNGSC
jgi:hypothetical protein